MKTKRIQALKLFAAFALILAPALGHAADPPPTGYAQVFVLWPGGAPLAKGTASVDIPKLYYYPPRGASAHSAVIVLPGGGYNHLVMEKEGADAAKWLAAHGVAAFVLQYRVAPYRFPAPMLDGARAVRYVRSHAADFGAVSGKIGLWGFSAGGHLAGYLATAPGDPAANSADLIDRVSAHPDFTVIAYGRLSLDPSIPRPTSFEPLVGDHPSAEALDPLWIDKHVTKATSPSFIYSTTGDQTVNSLNATAYYNALKRADVPAELHIFELGPHGTGLGQNVKDITELEIWPVLVQHWMQLHGWMAQTD
jgi:acetyl esterase/lipase